MIFSLHTLGTEAADTNAVPKPEKMDFRCPVPVRYAWQREAIRL